MLLAKFYKLTAILPLILMSIELCLSLTYSPADKSQHQTPFYLDEHDGDGGQAEDWLGGGGQQNGLAGDETQLSNTKHYDDANSSTTTTFVGEQQNGAFDGGTTFATSPTTMAMMDADFVRQTCSHNRGIERKDQFTNTYLTHCSRYKLENLFSNKILDSIMHEDSEPCTQILNEFIQLDATINQFDNLFIKLLSRYNCHNGYSVKWNCDDCKVSVARGLLVCSLQAGANRSGAGRSLSLAAC